VGRQVVLVSMGTCVTGDGPSWGWNVRDKNAEGNAVGLTGREMCHSVWGAAFDVLGSKSADEGPLIVVSLGPQENPLDQLTVPPNAVCLPVVPQVDVLKAGVDAFLTHGGQNSFMESLAAGTPVLVCPCLGDQPLNAQRAVSLGVGLKVDKPEPPIGEEATAIQQYRSEIDSKLRQLMSSPSFTDTAAVFRERLQRAGGVSRAVEVIMKAVAAQSRCGGA